MVLSDREREMKKINTFCYPGMLNGKYFGRHGYTDDGRGQFLSDMLALRAQGKMEEVKKLLATEHTGDGLIETWTTPSGSGREMFTLTREGVFRCWARPFVGYSVQSGHFDAGGDTALLFEATCRGESGAGTYKDILAWAKKWFVGDYFEWQGEHPGDRLWVGRKFGSA